MTFTKEQIIRCLTAFVPPDLADQAEEIARREVVKIEGSAQAAVLGDFADRLGRIPNEHLLWLTGKKARDEIATAARNWATFRADFPLFDPPTGGN
ncbi:hypothetical protein [Brevibacterium sp.]|uniref:hypothetical protein n=1 Tax=Brevibacterium sp. TaxID=1701 RepID=UPI002811D4AC|nr:hypothetical protein [Brevibacterium sp.]